MKTQAQEEHRWLEKLIGEWTYEGESAGEPGKPAERFSGIERVRPLGKLWVLCEGEGKMPDGEAATMLMTLGYDPKGKRYTGTWVGSMMTHLWVYDGQLDADRRVLTLSSDGPSFTGDDKMAPYQDIITFKDDDYRILTSQTPGEDGEWKVFMTAHYRRRK
jgi:hypothetical protein